MLSVPGVARKEPQRTVLPDARRQQLLAHLQVSGTISNQRIAQEFGVSMLTVRRDLEILEEQGLIRRVHGGARALSLPDTVYEHRLTLNRDAKRAIGALAASLVQDFETVYLDAGTTTIEVARALRQRSTLRGVRVVTHAINIAAELVDTPNFTVFCIGGEIFEETFASTGAVTVELISRYAYDRLFLGCMGFDPKEGMTNARLPEVEVKQAALERARWTALVADATKWNVSTFARIAPLTSVQALVSDDRLPEAARNGLSRLGVTVLLATA